MAARVSVPTTAQLSADPRTSFLDLAPPHWAARGLAWALIAVFALGAIASVAITLPEKELGRQFSPAPQERHPADIVPAELRDILRNAFLADEGKQTASNEL